MLAKRIDGAAWLECSSDEEAHLRQSLTFTNPEYAAALKFSPWTARSLPRHLEFFSKSGGLIVVPRRWGLSQSKSVKAVDRRVFQKADWPPLRGSLRVSQEIMLDALMERFSVADGDACASMPVASGKTLLGFAVGQRLGAKTLALVHTTEIARAWDATAEKFYGFTPGRVQQDKADFSQPLTVALVQTWIRRKDFWPEWHKQFGLVILDELHHIGPPSFSEALSPIPAFYRLGLSATPTREDGLTGVIYAFFGNPIVGQASEHSMPVSSITVVKTDYRGRQAAGRDVNWPQYLRENAENAPKADKLAEDVRAQMSAGQSCLVVAKTVREIIALDKALKRTGKIADVLIGATPAKARSAIVERIKSGKSRLVLSTLKLIEEGADLPVLSRLFVFSPVASRRALTQLLGRIQRAHNGKSDAQAFLYVDWNFAGKGAFFRTLPELRKKCSAILYEETSHELASNQRIRERVLEIRPDGEKGQGRQKWLTPIHP